MAKVSQMYKSIDNIYKKTAFSLIFAVFFVILDVFLKNYSLKNLEFHEIKVLGDIFKLSLAKNTGIAFSLPLSGPILNGFILLIISFLIYYYSKEIKQKKDKHLLPLTFIIVGAIMNFIDRIRFAYVIDYFNLKWFTVFNIADCMIVFGASFLVYKQMTEKRRDITDERKSK